MAAARAHRTFFWWSLGPASAFLVTIFLGPFLYMLWLSLTDMSFAATDRDGSFVGLANYARAFSGDSLFLASFGRSIVFAVLCVLPQVLLGLIVAEILHSHRLARRLLSPLLVLPVLLPSVVVGLYWRILLQGEFGLVSYYLFTLGFPWAKGILSASDTVLITLALIDLWHWGPFVCLVLLAARCSLSSTPLEAAWTDGASRVRAFFDVTLPRLLGITFVVSLIRAIDSFKEFDKIYILTGGGPGTSSELVSLHIWRTAFKQWEFGYAAALCVLVYIAIYAVTHLGMARIRLEVSP